MSAPLMRSPTSMPSATLQTPSPMGLRRTMTLSHEPVMKPEEYPYPDEATVIEAMRLEDEMKSKRLQEDKVSDAPSAFMSPLQRTMSVVPALPEPKLMNEFAQTPAKQTEALKALFGKLRHTRAVLPGLRRTDFPLTYEADSYDEPETYGGPNYPMPSPDADRGPAREKRD